MVDTYRAARLLRELNRELNRVKRENTKLLEYYSDPAIRERCLRMVYDMRIKTPDRIYRLAAIEEAQMLFNFIKTGKAFLQKYGTSDK